MEEEPVTQERGVGGGGLLLRLLLLLLDGERRHGDGGEGGGGLPLACHAAESGDREEEDQGGVDGGDVEGEKSFADAFPCGISYLNVAKTSAPMFLLQSAKSYPKTALCRWQPSPVRRGG